MFLRRRIFVTHHALTHCAELLRAPRRSCRVVSGGGDKRASPVARVRVLWSIGRYYKLRLNKSVRDDIQQTDRVPPRKKMVLENL